MLTVIQYFEETCGFFHLLVRFDGNVETNNRIHPLPPVKWKETKRLKMYQRPFVMWIKSQEQLYSMSTKN